MICREWSVKYFWEEYGEEEYEFDVLKHGAYWVCTYGCVVELTCIRVISLVSSASLPFAFTSLPFPLLFALSPLSTPSPSLSSSKPVSYTHL